MSDDNVVKNPIDIMVQAMIENEDGEQKTNTVDDAESVDEVLAGDDVSESDGDDGFDGDSDEDWESRYKKLKHQNDKDVRGKIKLRQERKANRDEIASLRQKIASLENSEVPDFADYGDDLDAYAEALEKHSSRAVTKVDTAFDNAKSALIDMAEDNDAPSDWIDVVTKDDVPFTEDIIIAMADLDNGHAVMYELAKKKEVLVSILNKRDPMMRALALRDFASGLSSKRYGNRMGGFGNERQNVSAIDPVGGTPRGRSNLDSLSVADHMKAIRSQRF